LIHLPRFRAMLRSLALAVVALLAVTDWTLVKQAATGPLAISVMVAGTLMLLVRVPPLIGVLAAIAVGIRW
jgi:chromate transport protein ChrA